MTRTALSLAGGLASALLLVSAPAAQAAVTAKDVPSKADIVKALPDLASAEFSSTKTKEITVPSTSCGTADTEKAKSARTTVAVSTTGVSSAVAGVIDTGSVKKAKAYMKAYGAFVKACASYTEPTTGAAATVAGAKAPKLGDQSFATTTTTSFSGFNTFGASIVIRDGARIATVGLVDDAAVSTSSLTKLAKVAAKKMR